MGLSLFSLIGAGWLNVGIVSALLSVVLPFSVISYLLIKGMSGEEKAKLAGLIRVTQWFYITLLVVGGLLMLIIGMVFSGG